ncbi:MAG: DUF416 family protein [Arsenophonus sp. NEOnobi-MAG3]
MFCKQMSFLNSIRYRIRSDLIWESLIIKDSKIDFDNQDNQLEKLEEVILAANDFDVYTECSSCY